jgi:hypothetical protein
MKKFSLSDAVAERMTKPVSTVAKQPKILCHEVIWENGGDPRVSTYCMRDKGHEGDHSPNS